MDSNNFLQYLIPGIFLIVWAIGKIFGGKKEEEKAQPKNVSKVEVNPFEDSSYELDDFGSIKLPSKPQVAVASTSLQHYKGTEKHQHQPAPIKVVKSTELPTVVSYKKMAKKREHLELLALLKNSNSVKRAFLTSEILGSPIALRQNGKTGPWWER